MKKSVLILKGSSNAEVLRIAAEEVAKGFLNRGYEIEFLDLSDESQHEIFWNTIERYYSFVFAIQFAGWGITIDHVPFTRVMKSPAYFGWIFDDVMYHYFRLLLIGKEDSNIHTFFVDAEMKKIVSGLNPFLKHMGHLPHGGFEGKRCIEKDIEILYPGNFGREPDMEKMIPSIHTMPVLKRILDDSLALLLERDCELTVREAVKAVLESYGEVWDAQIHYELSDAGIIEYIDQYLRHIYRMRTLEHLLEAGFSVCVVGTGYEEMKGTWGDAVTLMGKKDINEVTDLMARSRIVCNPCPPVFKEGAHERIFSAMLNRACCLTPYSEYQDHLFGEYVMFYRIDDSITMQRKVKHFLEHYDEWKREKAEKIYQYAKENHTWEKRGEQIIDYYERNIAGQ